MTGTPKLDLTVNTRRMDNNAFEAFIISLARKNGFTYIQQLFPGEETIKLASISDVQQAQTRFKHYITDQTVITYMQLANAAASFHHDLANLVLYREHEQANKHSNTQTKKACVATGAICGGIAGYLTTKTFEASAIGSLTGFGLGYAISTLFLQPEQTIDRIIEGLSRTEEEFAKKINQFCGEVAHLPPYNQLNEIRRTAGIVRRYAHARIDLRMPEYEALRGQIPQEKWNAERHPLIKI